MKMNDRLVWIDCEMTGLDIERDALIEIACLVTDGELNLLDEGIDLIIKPPAEALESMPDVVREMHTASGLLAELPGGIAVTGERDREFVHSGVVSDQHQPLRIGSGGIANGFEQLRDVGAVKFRRQFDLWHRHKLLHPFPGDLPGL